jgi:hypothetical protein
VVLAPDLNGGHVHEHVDELGPEGVADRERLVVHGDVAVGGDAAKHPLAGVVLVRIDRHRCTANAARLFFAQAIGRTRISPVEVTTDRYRLYPRVLDEMLPAAFHEKEAHANNAIETDHGRLKARLRPMRG